MWRKNKSRSALLHLRASPRAQDPQPGWLPWPAPESQWHQPARLPKDGP
jgi:hypothetical protein